jgi:PAS domain S-box-containing protein
VTHVPGATDSRGGSAQAAPERAPRLVLRFALYSAVALFFVGAALLLLISYEEREQAEERTAARATRVANRVSSALSSTDLARPATGARRARLDEVFGHELGDGLVHATLWNARGVVVYSDDRSSARVRDRSAVAKAIEGATVQRVIHLGDNGAGDGVEVLETIVPVRLPGVRRPAGALAVYYDYAPIAEDVMSAITPVAVGLGVALLLLYATLFPILHRVTRTLGIRNRHLSEHAEALADALEQGKRAERELSNAERRYRTLLEQLPVATYIDNLDATSSSIYMSPQIEGMLGYSPGEWLADPQFFPKVLHPEDRDRVLAEHERAYERGESFSSEYRLVANDGRVVWFRDEITIVRDESGRPLHAQGFLADITKRKEAEEALRESEARHRALVEQVPLVIYEDAADEHSSALYMSPQVEPLLGYSQEEWLGDRELFPRLLHPDDRERVMAEIARVHATGEPFSSEYRLVAKDGRVVWFRDEATHVVGDDGRALYSQGFMLDISERKQAEERMEELNAALTRREAQLAHAQAVAHIGSWHWDVASDVVTWSDELFRIFGREPQSTGLTYASYLEMVHPDDRPVVEATVGKAYETGEPFAFDHRVVRLDGSVRWIQARGEVTIADSRVTGMNGIAQDITERREAEEKHRDAEARYRTLVEHLPLAMYVRPLAWNAPNLYVSPNVEQMLGTPVEAWETDPDLVSKVVHPDDLELVLEGGRRVRETGEPLRAEYRCLTPDGRTVWVLDHTHLIRDEHGEPYCVQGFLLDITERKLTQEALRESEERFRTLVANVPGAIFRCAADADWTMEYVSDAIEEMSGYPASDFVHNEVRTFASIVHPEDADTLDDAVAEGRAYETQYRIVHRDGGVRWLHERGQAATAADGTVWLDGVIFDVTGRILAEAERERLLADLADQNERLRELDKLKDEFIALVSHELRTPLTSILGYTELLGDDSVGGLSDEQRQFVGVVERNSQRLLHLVGDLLFVAQVEAGRLVLELGTVDLPALAADSIEAARPSAARQGVALTLATEPVPIFAGDPARLGQLLDNLVSNAVKFTPSGGRVEVRLRALEGEALLEVRDSGIGIPAREQGRLFERFFRSSNATEGAIQGTGLGLSIAKAIVVAHDGAISFESEEGAGTVFRVTLPVARLEESARGTAVSAQ